MIEQGAVEKVQAVDRENEDKKVIHYLPWRFVVNHSSVSTKYRLCMDASSRPSAEDYSLNMVLLKGPNLTMDLAKCLIRFRLGKFRLIADIEKAFLQILILLQDRDALRFFWPRNPRNPYTPLDMYRFKSVLLGSISSPFLPDLFEI